MNNPFRDTVQLVSLLCASESATKDEILRVCRKAFEDELKDSVAQKDEALAMSIVGASSNYSALHPDGEELKSAATKMADGIASEFQARLPWNMMWRVFDQKDRDFLMARFRQLSHDAVAAGWVISRKAMQPAHKT